MTQKFPRLFSPLEYCTLVVRSTLMRNNVDVKEQVESHTTWYAVKKANEEGVIYNRWEEFQKKVFDKIGMHIRTFESLDRAREWLRKSRAHSSSRKRKRSTSCPPNNQLPTAASLVENVRTSDEEREFEDLDDADGPHVQVVLTATSFEALHVASQLPAAPPDTSLPTYPPHTAATTSSPADSLGPGHRDEGLTLSSEQQEVLNRVKAGRNMFFTGAAGTGKSFLLRQIVQWARDTYGNDAVAVTASTGLAAINIGGCTIYSWAGIKLGKEEPKVLWDRVKTKSWAMNEKTGEQYLLPKSPLKRWQTCKLLILDEVSMIDGKLIDKLDYIGRRARKNDSEPWGGIQVIYCGDFFQLPPVKESEENIPIASTLAFEAKSWFETVGKPVILKKVFRQTDSELIDMLHALRVGELREQHIRYFKALNRSLVCPEGMEPIQLYPKKNNVNNANAKRLTELEGEATGYRSLDLPGFTRLGYQFSKDIVRNALNRMVALEKVELKVGAQVMLIKNLVAGTLVNGSMGRVIGFKLAKEAFQEGIEFALPQCLNEVSKNGGKPKREDPPDILFKFDERWPLVEFTNARRRLLCVRTSFETASASGQVEAIRFQIPLIPAWAMSIHKSQGMSIDYLKVDLAESFEFGQVYVALSRATSVEGLQVCNFDPSGVKTHPRVVQWMRDGERSQV